MTVDKNLLQTLQKKTSSKTPFWFMRQAGRYLPEYRELRKQAGSFLDLCYNPALATEVTLQPISRFDMDGAILFSDILVLPHAMGVGVNFIEGKGPVVEITNTQARIATLSLDKIAAHCAPVFETIKRVKSALDPTKTLLGFAGAPWTVACYMIEGKGSKDFAAVRQFTYEQPELFSQIITQLTDATILYLSMQIEAGVDAVQLFDSWAGVLSPAQFERYVIEPNQKIIATLKEKYPGTGFLCFPRGAGSMLGNFASQVASDGLSIDTMTPIAYAKQAAPDKVLQGNLDPLLLASDIKGALKEAENILRAMKDTPFIFNLGHGMVPHTPIEHVEALCHLIKNFH